MAISSELTVLKGCGRFVRAKEDLPACLDCSETSPSEFAPPIQHFYDILSLQNVRDLLPLSHVALDHRQKRLDELLLGVLVIPDWALGLVAEYVAIYPYCHLLFVHENHPWGKQKESKYLCQGQKALKNPQEERKRIDNLSGVDLLKTSLGISWCLEEQPSFVGKEHLDSWNVCPRDVVPSCIDLRESLVGLKEGLPEPELLQFESNDIVGKQIRKTFRIVAAHISFVIS